MKLAEIAEFSHRILSWDLDIDRGMPWQGEKNPYLIWLSEILLQQTRVEQGLPYYLRFRQEYPTIQDLANAQDDQVFRLWQGLGYYSRCRNLLATARHISNNLDGEFPNQYSEIINLKGVGPYTAAAISSFAFGHSIPVIDGNVTRVVSRYMGMILPIDSKKGYETIATFSRKAISEVSDSAAYNQAIMNFGALQCLPKNPKCSSCVLKKDCIAFNTNIVQDLPIKEKKIKKRKRFFVYLHIDQDDQILIQQRTAKDIWQQLYQLPLIEVDEKEFASFTLSKDLIPFPLEMKLLSEEGKYGVYKQQLTHQRIHVQYLKFSLSSAIGVPDKSYLWVHKSQLDKYAFPKVILDYFKASVLQELLPF